MPGRWTAKPPYGTPLDRSHPLAQGLQGFYAANEGGGPTLYDAAGALPLAASGGATWGVGPAGVGLLLNAAGASFSATLPAALRSNWPVSWACGIRQIGTPDTFAGFVTATVSSAWSSPFTGWGWQDNTRLETYWTGASNFVTANAYTLNTDKVWSATVTASSQAFYANGLPDTSQSNSIANSAWTSTAQLIIGSQPAQAHNARCLIYWVAWWTRALSAAEHAAIGASPAAIWRVFRPRHDTLFVFGSPAVQDPVGVASDTSTLCMAGP